MVPVGFGVSPLRLVIRLELLILRFVFIKFRRELRWAALEILEVAAVTLRQVIGHVAFELYLV